MGPVKDRFIHIIAPNLTLAQNFARRNQKYPHLIDRYQQLYGLSANTPVYYLTGDDRGSFDYSGPQLEQIHEIKKLADSRRIDLKYVKMEHEIE